MALGRSIVVLSAVLSLVSACSGDDPGRPRSAEALIEDPLPPSIDPYEPAIDPADFEAWIDNRYFPLEPGSRWVYEGLSDGEKEVVTVSVTRRTKEVMGVICTVVKDVAAIGGEVTEKTFDWFVRDRFGNVWYFGEYTEEYENGKVDTAGSWEAGVDGALPGIVMLAQPDVGERYRQEYFAGEAEDMGRVLELDRSIEVPFGSFEDVLVTKDWTPLEPQAVEHKYYAPGVGVILERAVKGGRSRLELVEYRS